MRDSERRFQAIVQQAAVGIVVADLAGRMLEVNGAFHRMLGYSEPALEGRTVSEITHPDEREAGVELFAELAAGKRDAYQREKRYLRSDGSVVWGRVNAAVVRDEDGAPELVVAAIEDVDARRNAEERLREAEERYRTLVEQLPLVTYIDALDERSSNLYTSPQLEPILGYTVDEWQGDPDLFVSLLHPDDRERVLAEIAVAHESGDPWACEYRLLARDGRTVWFRDEWVVVRGPGGEPLYSQGYLVDITERKQAAQALARREAALEAVARIAGELAGAPSWQEVDLLQPLGRAVSASRAYIFENAWTSDGRLVARQVAEWASDGVDPLIDDPVLQTFDYAEAGWDVERDRLASGEVVAAVRPAVSDAMRRELERTGILSMLLVPVTVEGDWWGWVGFDDCAEARTWSDAEIGALRAAAGVLGGALQNERASRALQETRDSLEAVVDTSPAAIVAFDPAGNVLMWNPAAERIFGWPADEVVGSFNPLVTEETLPEFLRYVERALQGESWSNVELRRRRRDGAPIDISSSGAPLRNADGDIVGFASILLDVSEEKGVRDSLRESEARFAAFMDTTPAVAFAKDAEGRYVYVNARWTETFGNRLDEIAGKTDAEVFPRDALAYRTADDTARAAGGPTEHLEHAETKDGLRAFLTLKFPFHDASGAQYVGGVALDVTERERTQAALAETTQTLEAIVDSSPLAIITFDAEGRVAQWSEAAERTFGWSADEVIGRFNPLLPAGEEETFRRAVSRAITGKSWREVEMRRRRKDGVVLDVSVSSAPLRDASGEAVGMVAMLADISERKRAEGRLAAQHAVTSVLAASASVEEAAPVILDAVCDALGWDLGGLWLVDAEQDVLRPAAMHAGDGQSRPFVRASLETVLPRGVGLPGRVWAAGEPLWVVDVPSATTSTRGAAAAEAGLMSAIAAPVESGGDLLGVIEFFARTVREPDDDMLAMLTSVGRQIGQFARRVEADRAVREREERFRTLVSNLPGAVYRCAPDEFRTMGFMSDAIEAISGYAATDFIENAVRPYASIIHTEDRDEVTRAVAAALARTEPFELEYRVVHADGSPRWVSEKGLPVVGAAGEALWLDGAIFDVTEQKRAQAELAQERDLMRLFMHATPDHVYFKDADSRFLRISDALARWFGLDDPGGAIGKTDADFFSEEHASKALSDERELMRTGEPMLNLEDRETWEDGRETWVVSSRLPLRDERGVIVGTFGISRDITDRKRNEVELARANALLDSIVENIPNPLFLKDAEDFRFQRVNRAAEELWGYDRADLLGKSAGDFFPPDQAAVFLAEDRDVVERRRLLDIPAEAVDTRDRGVRYLHTRKVPILGEAGRPEYLLGISLDITDARHAASERERLLAAERAALAEAEGARAKLLQQNESLRALDRMKDEFVALVSHELRTPLTSILGYLELILEGDAGEVSDDQQHFLSIIERNAQRLLRLVGDLLFVAQIEAGKLAIEQDSVDLLALAKECLEAARPRAAEKQIELGLDGDEVLELVGDRVRLAQLLDNLVSNAIKFTPDGGRVGVRLSRVNGHALLAVWDSGIGIPEAEQEQLYQRFFRSSAATASAIQGTGLGLTITKAIVEAHGGSIVVESAEGRGTTFTVDLPLDERPAPGSTASALQPIQRGGHPTG